MRNKTNRQRAKEKREREKYEKIKRGEYSKKYLEKKDKRNQMPMDYPKTRLILIRDFIKSKDLYKAIGLFLGSQLSVFLLIVGGDHPEQAPLISLLSMFIGSLCVILSIIEINKRQAIDPTRKKLSVKTVLSTLLVVLFATTILSIISASVNITPDTQANQELVNSTLENYPIAMLFSVLIVAPIVEELIFRELLPYATGPSYLSFIIISLFFTIVHSPAGILGWASYGIASAAFLRARLKNNNVYASVWVHILWNTISLLI